MQPDAHPPHHASWLNLRCGRGRSPLFCLQGALLAGRKA